jgi:hypothetical protein
VILEDSEPSPAVHCPAGDGSPLLRHFQPIPAARTLCELPAVARQRTRASSRVMRVRSDGLAGAARPSAWSYFG